MGIALIFASIGVGLWRLKRAALIAALILDGVFGLEFLLSAVRTGAGQAEWLFAAVISVGGYLVFPSVRK